MNVFYLSSDPIQAAQFQCDRHLHTSFRDTVILLSSVIQSNATAKEIYLNETKNWPVDLFDPCESTNPWFIWAKKNPANFSWLTYHADGIAHELEWRALMPLMRKRNSMNQQILTSNFVKFANFAMASNPCELQSLPPLVMPVEFKNLNPSPKTYDDIVDSYRAYYIAKMRQAFDADNNFVWTNRSHPAWMDQRFEKEIPQLPPRFKVQSSIRPLINQAARESKHRQNFNQK
jgi:hypothetical protein